jgi:F0F1-type ATP synthase membrane subunit a
MQEIMKSIATVTSSPFFWFYMGLVVVFGMTVGGRLNEGVRGFYKSMTILIPFVVIIILTNTSRIYYISLETPLTHSAYNSYVSLVLTALFYIAGLFLGHMIVSQAIKDGRKQLSSHFNVEKTQKNGTIASDQSNAHVRVL